MTARPDDDTCAACSEAFHCGADDAGACWCVEVAVPVPVLAELSARHEGCLCPRCLDAAATDRAATR